MNQEKRSLRKVINIIKSTRNIRNTRRSIRNIDLRGAKIEKTDITEKEMKILVKVEDIILPLIMEVMHKSI